MSAVETSLEYLITLAVMRRAQELRNASLPKEAFKDGAPPLPPAQDWLSQAVEELKVDRQAVMALLLH